MAGRVVNRVRQDDVDSTINYVQCDGLVSENNEKQLLPVLWP